MTLPSRLNWIDRCSQAELWDSKTHLGHITLQELMLKTLQSFDCYAKRGTVVGYLKVPKRGNLFRQ